MKQIKVLGTRLYRFKRIWTNVVLSQKLARLIGAPPGLALHLDGCGEAALAETIAGDFGAHLVSQAIWNNAGMAKIEMKTPVIELDGDETACIVLDSSGTSSTLNNTISASGIGTRLTTRLQSTAHAIALVQVGVKSATVTPNEALRRMYHSANGKLRNTPNDRIFREPMICENARRLVPGSIQPIVVSRRTCTGPPRPGQPRQTRRQSAASAAFSVALGRIAADTLAGSGR